MLHTPLVFSDDGGGSGRGCGQKEAINGGQTRSTKLEVCVRAKSKSTAEKGNEKRGGGRIDFLG